MLKEISMKMNGRITSDERILVGFPGKILERIFLKDLK